jgi:uncharacterized lipoprotein YehR (DUF1307 family)
MGQILKKRRRSIMNMKRIIASVLALVMCFALAACGKEKDSEKGSYKDAIENLIAVTYELKSAKIKDLAPKDVWDCLLEAEDVTMDDVKEAFEDTYSKERYEEQFGSNFKASYDILEKEKVDSDELDDFKDYVEEEFGISGSKVKSSYSLEVEFTLEGSEDSTSFEQECYAVQIGSDWYLLDEDGDFYAESLVGFLF